MIRAGDEVQLVWSGGSCWLRVGVWQRRGREVRLEGLTTLNRWCWARLSSVEVQQLPAQVLPDVYVAEHRRERNEALRRSWVRLLLAKRPREKS